MAYVMGQVAVASNTVPLFTVPSGLCNFTFYQANNTTIPTYVGTSTALTSSNGMVCPVAPGVPFQNYVSSKGATFYVANTSATTVTVSYFMSTDQ